MNQKKIILGKPTPKARKGAVCTSLKYLIGEKTLDMSKHISYKKPIKDPYSVCRLCGSEIDYTGYCGAPKLYCSPKCRYEFRRLNSLSKNKAVGVLRQKYRKEYFNIADYILNSLLKEYKNV